jgi:mRNA-degrading endonuclease toxin of MazEF toxin-antitoxin module
MSITSGEVIKMDISIGISREHGGYQTVVIVSDNEFMEITNRATLVPISDEIEELSPNHIELKEGDIKGTILCEHFTSIDLEDVSIKHIGYLPSEILEKIRYTLVQETFKFWNPRSGE